MQNHTHSVLCASDAKVLNYPKFITILPQHNLTSVMNINKLVVNKSLQNLTNKYVVIFGSCNKPECFRNQFEIYKQATSGIKS